MKGLLVVILLVMTIIFPAAGFAAGKAKLSSNQLMVTDGKVTRPVPIQRVMFTEDCIIIQFSKDRIVTNPYGAIKVIYTDDDGDPHSVVVDHRGGYVLAGGEVLPLPAKLVNIAAYNPFIDD